MSKNIVSELIVRNMDDIAVMQDDELAQAHYELEGARRNLKRQKAYSKDIEVELCYLQRELQIRADRREVHKAYAETESFVENENDLPNADLDNSSYVHAWNVVNAALGRYN